MLFSNRSGHVPGQAEVKRERRQDPPIIRDEGAINLPAAAGDRSLVRLVVNGPTRETEQEIGLRIARGAIACGKVAAVADKPEAILEGLRAHVHLIGAEVEAHPQFMLVQDEIERVFEREDVRSTLERGEAAIAEGPIAAVCELC